MEGRLRTLVLVAAGLDEGIPPEVDGLNFAPRVRVPVLMVNGRYDWLDLQLGPVTAGQPARR